MSEDLIRKLVAEAIGTFYLCFIGAGAILVDHHLGGGLGLVGIALAHGLALAIAVTATMNISGGHINPAVSVTMLVCGRLEPREAVGYIAAQLGGGSVAGVALWIIYKGFSPGAIEATNLGTPNLEAGGTGFLLGIFVEALLTFLLLFSIFGTAVDSRAPSVGGFGIGLTVGFDILMGGPITGASMNPARTFGTALPIGYFPATHLVYWIGPILGAVLAGLLYTSMILPKEDRQ